MKRRIVLLAVVSIFTLSATGYAWDSDDPMYNQNLRNTPNFNPNYYEEKLDVRGYDAGQRTGFDTPYGNDIRDYNPYYDRNGQLKQPFDSSSD